ncbi:DUF1848 domain-containing protein [Sinanaerobacter sp. ZZT-01]|uniref:DUF1848 domain-containing protein n=1 Tax=Sinanaerobacter sp. ZZT-01 TaxID=3111540 RepID=UPI002D77FEF7|nr:DUF1848 domain-containing protein [Sinanaerobacter sp. ZZT-01]WRR92431.1 DUF1848 domain-containing protein [Sinanaerobacter sp. ZZT-01]
MIISASRRTDIPAFYTDWFFNRIKEGYILVRNPMNPHQISKIDVSPDVVDCIVFWTKNPIPMLRRLKELQEYQYYFQFTLTSYDKTIERYLTTKKDLVAAFIALSKQIGRQRVIWRYDPILLSHLYTKEYHYKWFDKLAQKLSPYTDKCIISFLDQYKNTEKNLHGVRLFPITKTDIEEMAVEFSRIASQYGLILESCAEPFNLEKYNIFPSRCIDDRLLSQIWGKKIRIEKDPNQRKSCGCVKSIDIGAYNTCKHGCRYCYANFSDSIVRKNISLHKTDSPLLFGELGAEDRITDRKMISYIDNQMNLSNFLV